MRYCTEEDFIKVNAGHIWKQKFSEGEENDGYLLCDSLQNVL